LNISDGNIGMGCLAERSLDPVIGRSNAQTGAPGGGARKRREARAGIDERRYPGSSYCCRKPEVPQFRFCGLLDCFRRHVDQSVKKAGLVLKVLISALLQQRSNCVESGAIMKQRSFVEH